MFLSSYLQMCQEGMLSHIFVLDFQHIMQERKGIQVHRFERHNQHSKLQHIHKHMFLKLDLQKDLGLLGTKPHKLEKN
jgi:hypothetical protein